MHETYQPPTTSPAGPPHDHTHPRHSHIRPRHSHTRPRHSRTYPRHSHTPTSFPRRRESPPPCIAFDKTELTYYHRTMTTPQNHIPRRQPQCTKHPTCQPRHSATQTVARHPTPNRRAPQETTPNSPSAKFDRMRHNPTESHTMQRKLVPARTRARHPLPSFPRRRESSCPPAFRSFLGMDRIRRIALELPSHSRHANKSNEPRRTITSLASMNRIHWNACGPLPAAVASASEVPQCPSQT